MGVAAPMIGLAGTALQAGGGIANMMGQQKAQKQQQENVNNWYLQQYILRAQEMRRQRDLGFKSQMAHRGLLDDSLGSTAQKNAQRKEADRLTVNYGSGTSAAATPASDASIGANSQPGILTGQSGGDSEFRSDLARRLNNRAEDARGRIAALATMNSYGDSFGGLGTVNPMAIAATGQDINMFNNFRRGSLQAYGVEKQIEPQQVQYRGSPAAMAMQAGGGFLSGLGGGLGKGGGIFS